MKPIHFLLLFFSTLSFISLSHSATLGIPINKEFYTDAVNTQNYGYFFCNFNSTYGGNTPNPFVLPSPVSAKSNISSYVCFGFSGKQPNKTQVVNPGDIVQFTTINTDKFKYIYTYRFFSTDSTFENPVPVFLNQTLSARANGTELWGSSFLVENQQTLLIQFVRGPGLFYYKENLTGPGDVFGVVNISCPLDPDGKPQLSCVYDPGTYTVPAYKRHLSDFLSWFTLILLWISIGGALLTILTFTVHYEIRTYPIKLIMYLCVCIILSNFFFLMGFETGFQKNDSVCYLTGMTIHGFFLANFCWTLCIAFNFYQMIVRRNRESESLEKFYHLFSWGLPIFCVEWIGGFKHYGLLNGGVCYVTNSYFMFAFFFLPGLIILALNIILFFFVAREIHDTLASAPASNKQERKKECRVYISICISIGLSWVFGFIMILFTVYWINLIFLFLFTIFTGLQGFLIFLSYCLNMKVAAKWAGLIGKCIPFFRRFENMDTRKSTRSGDSKSSNSSRGGSSTASAESSVDSEMSATTDD